MKKLIINESIYNRLFKPKPVNEAMDDTFSFDELKSLRSFSAMRQYCKAHCGNPIGKGSSRECYQIDDDKILKLAINAKGIAQNEHEMQNCYHLNQLGVIPEVFQETDFDTFKFIVCEYVLPAKEQDFVHYTGLSSKDFFVYIRRIYNCYSRSGRMYNSNYGEFLDEDNEYYEELYKWYDFMANYQIEPVGDMVVMRNYGISKNNGLVLLDNGLDEEVYKKFYKKW